MIARPDLPDERLSRRLAHWLRGPRSRALRRAGIGRREGVLEVGCGHGHVTGELARRARGTVVAIDRVPSFASGERPGGQGSPPLLNDNGHAPDAGDDLPAAADGRALPFADDSLDLVFFQTTLMWIDPAHAAVHEAARVLQQGGALVALEPDYGGMIEEPDLGLRVVWLDALERAGADPMIGRTLPRLAAEAGLDVWVEFAHIPREAEAEAVDLLAELPLTVRERERVAAAREIIVESDAPWSVFLHVPWVLIVATLR